MRLLLLTTAIIEVGAGLALLAAPAAVAQILLGASLDPPVGYVVARVGGTALVSLGLVCWFARRQASGSVTPVILGMLLYNTAVVAILAAAAIGPGLVGIALWPAAVLHAAMTVWCVLCLRIHLSRAWSTDDGTHNPK